MTRPLTADLPDLPTPPPGDSDAGETDAADAQPRSKLLDLSLTQLLGGSMAAATAAALGSRLGVVGSIAGAAVLSVVSAIAGALYTGSMARARDAVVLVRSRRDGGAVRPVPALPARTRTRWTRPDRVTTRRALATTGAVFALAAAFLAGLQLATGASVTGTNLGGRTTAGVVVDGATGSADGSADGDRAGSAGQDPASSSGAATADPTATRTESGTDSSAGATTPAADAPTAPATDAGPSGGTTADPAQPSPAATTPATPGTGGSTADAPAANPAVPATPAAGSTPTP